MALYLSGMQIDLSKRFPDGTFAFKIDPALYMHKERTTIRWHYEREDELIALWYIKSRLTESNISNVRLEMLYVPNARMDRMCRDDDVFTLKYFCDMINYMGFSNVVVLDPHSSVTPALLSRCTVNSPERMIWASIQDIGDKDLALFYPDEGSMKRYACLIKKPFGFGIKNRDWNTGKILGLQVVGAESLKGRNVLIVDDICSRGGTFFHSAKALKDAGVKDIYLYVTHCENTILEGDLLEGDLIKRVYTTNSIFTKDHHKIYVLRLKGGE